MSCMTSVYDIIMWFVISDMRGLQMAYTQLQISSPCLVCQRNQETMRTGGRRQALSIPTYFQTGKIFSNVRQVVQIIYILKSLEDLSQLQLD